MNEIDVPFNKPSLVGNEIKYVRDAVRRGQLAGDGTYTERCCNLLKAQLGAPSVLLTHSCTAALEMAAMLCDLAPGDEVIMPSFTFVSTANAVVLRGATPVFVDIDVSTLCMAPDAVEAAITEKTRAIFAVHYAGFPADIERLVMLAKAHDLFLVEDAAQALGSTYNGQQAGTFGDAATFSFHETKNVISGEGGALVINRPDWVERAEIIREKGTNRSQFFRGAVDKYTWVDVGSSYLPGELIAAFLLAQIETQDAIRTRRLSVFDTYFEAFEAQVAQRQIRLPDTPLNCEGNGHMFYLLMDSLNTRTEFINFMRQNGVITPFHYVPLHSSPGGQKFGRTSGDLRVTNMISDTLVRLPMFFDLGSDVETVIEVANRALENT